MLLAARVVQAGGTAVMMPLLMTTLMTVVPEHDRGRVMGNVTLAMSVAPALGPGGLGRRPAVPLLALDVRLVLPIAAVIGVLGLRRLHQRRRAEPGSVDWFSVVIAALGFGSLVYGLSQVGAARDQRGRRPSLLIVAARGRLGVFVWRQLSLQRSGTAAAGPAHAHASAPTRSRCC